MSILPGNFNGATHMNIHLKSIVPIFISVSLVGCGTPPTETSPQAVDEADSIAPEPATEYACRTEFGESHPATVGFWEALRADNKEIRNDVIADLGAAMELHPDEEIFALLHGMANLWKIAEPLPEEDGDMAVQAMGAMDSRASLEKAWEICPSDYRITAWLGPILYRMGKALQDEEMIQEGLDVLNLGIEKYPEFVLFSQLLVYADEDPDSPEFQNAFAAIQGNVEACSDTETNSSDDVVIEENTDDDACSNHYRAAHNVEGSSLFVGDVYAKAGDLETARRVYEQGLAFKDSGTWSYSHLLEGRLANLENFSETAHEDDELKGAGWIWASQVQCAVCHTH